MLYTVQLLMYTVEYIFPNYMVGFKTIEDVIFILLKHTFPIDPRPSIYTQH